MGYCNLVGILVNCGPAYKGERLMLRVQMFAGSILSLAMILTACGGGDTDAGAPDPASTEGPGQDANGASTEGVRGHLTVATVREPESLGADFACTATFGLVSRQVLEALVQRHPETNALVPALATEWQRLDELTWEFSLREGVEFHDGSPMNAESIVGSLNFMWDPDGEAIRCQQFAQPAFEAVVIDEYTVRMNLEAPEPTFDMLMWLIPIQSYEQIQAAESLSELQQAPIGTGPYQFESWNRGQSIELSANDNWWGNNSSDGLGAVNFDTVSFIIRPDAQSRIAAVEAGEADVAERLPRDPCGSALGDGCLQQPGIDTAMLRMDHTSEIMGDIRIREAIALAVDKQAIADFLIGGVMAALLVPPGSVGYSDNIDVYPYDPDRARELVEEARADGVPIDNGITFVIETEKFAGIGEAHEAIAGMLTAVGLSVNIEAREPAVFSEEWSSPERPIPSERNMMVLHQHSNRFSDFQATAASYYLCEGRLSTYCNEEFEELMEAGSRMSGDERHATFSQAVDIAHEEFAFVPVVHMDLFTGISERLNWHNNGQRPDSWLFLKELSFKGR